MNDCQRCGAPLDGTESFCRACGVPLVDHRQLSWEYNAPPSDPYEPWRYTPPLPDYAPCYPPYYYTRAPYRPLRSMAAVLAFLLGSVGVHKFYCKRVVQGIVYLLLCWTLIPALVALIEGVIYLCYTDEQFDSIYAIS